MASAIDASKPVDGVPAVKADLRANLAAAKSEIEALQSATGGGAATAPILVTGDLTLVAATHHGKNLEISAASSPKITCAQIGAGVRCKIHRPIHQPSPILLPPNTTGIWLEGGSGLGFNRIWAGGHAEIEYSGGNIPTVRGDLQWAGRPAVAQYASLGDIVDLRRGEGLSTAVVGDPISSWTSQGVASDVYSNATGGTQPILTADGTLYCDPTSAISYLANTSRTELSGEVLCIAVSYKVNSFASGEPHIAQFREDGNNRLRLSFTSSTNHRLTVSHSSGNVTTFTTEFGTGQTWRAVVHVLDKINASLYTLSNSRHATGTNRLLLSAVTAGHFPIWESWTLAGSDNAVGAPFTASGVFEIAGYSVFEEADAIVGSTVDWDFMLRVLGQMRSLFPLGEDG